MTRPANDRWHPLLGDLHARIGHDYGDVADKLLANAERSFIEILTKSPARDGEVANNASPVNK